MGERAEEHFNGIPYGEEPEPRTAQDIADEAHFWRTGEMPEDRRAQPHNPPGTGSAKNRARNARRKRQKDREREQ